jgi:hypothetical protein
MKIYGLEIDVYGNKRYYLNDLLHRDDGPACEYTNGDRFWCQHGKIHRLDGPAYESNVIKGYKEWYFHNKFINCNSQKEFEDKIAELIFS